MTHYNNIEHQKYLKEYQDFASKNTLGVKHLRDAIERIDFSKSCQILYYRTTNVEYKINSDDDEITFLVVPSIFNSPEILFINQGNGFIDNLKHLGDVYLINWLKITEPAHSLNEYTQEVIEVLNFLKKKSAKTINLIGHCIGGNLALAASIIRPDFINTLTMLTSPWDFSNFSAISMVNKYINLDDQVRSLTNVPKIYIQIIFFLLAPEYFANKVGKFFKIICQDRKRLFLAVEHWLMSGNSLPKATYFQIKDEFIMNNIQPNTKWIINGKIINPSLLRKPVCLVIAENDKIAPSNSILPLNQVLKNSTILQVKGGHIHYLISEKNVDFFKRYKTWLGL